MPFLNDMLDETSRKRLEQQRLAEDNAGELLPAEVPEPNTIESRYRFDVNAIMRAVRGEILGQDEAVDAVERMLHIVRADIADPRRPLHTALFLGPTGVGKTELVRAVARALHGDADAFCRVDMNTLSQEHYAAALTGAPPGYVGSKEGTTILNQELIEGSLGKPGIVLFDELEKASDEVVQALLNVFDNGMLTVASGERTYSFRNALVFMTSNLGARRLQSFEERRERFPGKLFPMPARRRRDKLYQMMERELLRRFVPEFVNRIDTITVFNWIHGDVVEQLVDLELVRLNRRLRKHSVELQLEPSVRAHIAREGFDRKYGARSLRRAMRHRIEAPLAHFLLTEFRSAGGFQSLEAHLKTGKVRFRAVANT
ncbi:ATP-dependent Clp protease ATP-binding subunit ClpA [Natronocella acetinitrilica]|uniref:ATP-dependent Clp protease ATP-binding subunit ClpA n=1 Tax=Natronocella acetinitrilica TaxID=414046 RepID=A0AAE3KDF7_9GAMM|nr:AAA family ATPase [Natronocella acetinitrilica]MCP1676776.1 ATP-dependent Clp protease ATP-binding subunit ClpA [Natronocella acetinitrilica]